MDDGRPHSKKLPGVKGIEVPEEVAEEEGLPEDLDASVLGPYTVPNVTRRRRAGAPIRVPRPGRDGARRAIHIARRAIPQCFMQALEIVKLEIPGKPHPRVPHRAVVM